MESNPLFSDRAVAGEKSSSSSALQSDSHTSIPGEGLTKLSNTGSRSNEEWEDWMEWDGLADATESPRLSSQSSMAAKQSPSGSKKRKSLSDNEQDVEASTNFGKAKPPPGTRSHNIVERRYRININQKIDALRDSIPSLRATKQSEPQPIQSEEPPTQKLNKATVLSTAVDYIHDLEKDKRRLENEISQLKAHLRAVKQPGNDVGVPDKVLDVGSSATSPNESQMSTCTSTGSSASSNPVQGMIEVPEDMRRLRTASLQAQYAETSYMEHYDSTSENQSTIHIGEKGAQQAKFVGKLMVGSLACLMVMQGFSGSETDAKKLNKRGLLAVPTQLLWPSGQKIWAQHGLEIAPHQLHILFVVLKISIVLFTLGFGVFLYAFCSKPKPRSQPQKLDSPPSLASPLEVRRNAWLTAIQTVRVPRHEMLPEWGAVNLEALQYVLRHIIGWRGYSWLTGQSEDDEVARVRAWEIAIDAQLMGGDAEISGSRLILTILASGTLPKTPARLMLKAIHLRILLWKASGPGEGSVWSVVHRIAALLADQQWRLAQDMQRKSVLPNPQSANDVEGLPEHLAALLQLSCSEVLKDPIIQRAHNLAWSRPTREDVHGTDDEMDLVVEDSTIRSPHDALCAWLSSTTLQRALFASFSHTEDKASELDWDFGVALHTAPPASIAQARALAANAVFVEANHQSALSMLLQDFVPKEEPEDGGSASSLLENTAFIDSSLPKAVCYDLGLATYCALALGTLKKAREEPEDLKQALHTVSLGYQEAKELTWLSFASAYHLIHAMQSDDRLYDLYRQEIYRIRSRLLSWFKDTKSSEGAIDQHTRTDIESALSKHIATNDELDVASVDGTKTTPNPTVPNNAASAQPQGTSSIGNEAFSSASHTASSSDSPTPPCREPETAISKMKDRRASRCSEDSGYGSAEA